MPESKKRVNKLLIDLGLEDKANAKARELSGGMKRRVQIAKALVHDPDVVILDEPTAGVDIELRHLLWKNLKNMNQNNNKTIVLTTHYIEEAENLCDEVAIIDNGKIIAQGTPSDLIKTDGESHINIAASNWNQKYLEGYEVNLNSDNTINIKSNDTEKDIPIIIEKLAKNGAAINKLNVKKASLEDVFIKLTGKRIDD